MKINIQKIAYRAIPVLTAFVILVASVGVPAKAASSDLRSIYDGNLTKQEQNRLSSIDIDDVENASLPSYHFWRVFQWLYKQAGIDVEFPGGAPASQDVLNYLFTWPVGGTSFQVRPYSIANAKAGYYLDQFTGLRGGTRSFQNSNITYSNFNWQIGDLFVGYYTESGITSHYVAMYRGQDYLEFCVAGDKSSVYLSDARDIFSRTYNCYAVIRPEKLAGEWSVVDYNDYIGNLYTDGTNDIVTIDFASYLCGAQINDSRGVTYLPGQSNGYILIDGDYPGASIYFPGSYITHTVLDLSNIPNGSVFESSGVLQLDFTDAKDEADACVAGLIDFGIAYFDADFNIIRYQIDTVSEFYLQSSAKEFSWTASSVVSAPADARYCVYYGTFDVTEKMFDPTLIDGRIGIIFDANVSSLQMTISSLYRLQEETGKQNELLDQIITGTPEQNEIAGNVTGNLNNSSDAMQGAMGELGSLGDLLAGVEKPPMDDIDIRVDGMVDHESMLAYTGTILAFWDNPTLVSMLVIVVTLVLVSWVFFGKKV